MGSRHRLRYQDQGKDENSGQHAQCTVQRLRTPSTADQSWTRQIILKSDAKIIPGLNFKFPFILSLTLPRNSRTANESRCTGCKLLAPVYMGLNSLPWWLNPAFFFFFIRSTLAHCFTITSLKIPLCVAEKDRHSVCFCSDKITLVWFHGVSHQLLPSFTANN